MAGILKAFEARTHQITLDISKGLARSPIGSLLAAGDTMADIFKISLVNGETAADLNGCTAEAYFVRADMVTVINPATIDENTISVTLENPCYEVDGAFYIAVNVMRTDGLVRTVAIFDGRMIKTQTGINAATDGTGNKAAACNAIMIDGNVYTLRTGSEGAAGYVTFVLEE